MFYLIVDEGTLIDWWIITRETAFILIYLVAISYFLYGNEVKMSSAAILMIIYVIHILLMKYSSKYEIGIKK
jgi:Ca2+/Na+ antiporter